MVCLVVLDHALALALDRRERKARIPGIGDVDEVDRVGNTFDYPAQVAYNAYFSEPERDEGDETIDQVLVQEYEESDDAGDDYYFDDTPDDNYFSD